MTFHGHMDSIGLPQPASNCRLHIAIGLNGPNAAGVQLPATDKRLFKEG
jgi:hypothetical protein